ncbi:MAG TPA: host attachment protein, partial [Arenibaculum sp.]|nr:host attachment protein [Arenibaculum sp.]
MRRHAKIWIVVADGGSARILQHRTWEPGKFEEVANETSHEVYRPAVHCIVGARFEQHIADIVGQAANHGLFDALVLVAPSHTLGLLRRALNPAASERLILKK